MFRAERPQKGRSRQFHQIGVEMIGSPEPQADAEVIAGMSGLLRLFGVKDFAIKLNSIGCKDDKSAFAEKLKEHLKNKTGDLCEDCNDRLKKNVLRVLDCKNEKCIRVVEDAPGIASSLCQKCAEHFLKVKDLLAAFNIPFEEVKNLVRGLDYYTGTVFEVTHKSLGAQDALGAGGRYDNLVKDMGGPDKAAVGFALGLERVIITLDDDTKKKLNESKLVCIITHGDSAEIKIKARELAGALRQRWNGMPTDRSYNANIITRVDSGDSSLKSKMRNADKNNAGLVIILGEDEISQNKASLKDMGSKEPQISVDMASVAEEVGRKLKLC
jgi:histidyl-tRNA synthetase